jgi:hypothetical protein
MPLYDKRYFGETEMKKEYCAIIGDMNKSRLLPQRSKAQKKFIKAIETINQEFRQHIAWKFVITLGDEFQGLLASSAESYRFVRRFQELVEPLSFSFGIGVGGLSTLLPKQSLATLDGECFHRARASLSEAKSYPRGIFYSTGKSSDLILNELVGVLVRHRQRLTDRQRQIVALMEQFDNQQTVAKKLKISQQAVSKASHAPFVEDLLSGDRRIQEFLYKTIQP